MGDLVNGAPGYGVGGETGRPASLLIILSDIDMCGGVKNWESSGWAGNERAGEACRPD